FDDLARQVPTYNIHAYYDTGMRRSKNSQILRVLAPMTSFGHFLEHTGSLHGWDHALSGPGLERIAPNFYRIPVPNDGVVTVTTRITALEQPRPWWWYWLNKLIRLLKKLLEEHPPKPPFEPLAALVVAVIAWLEDVLRK